MTLIQDAQKILGVDPDGGWGRITHDAFLKRVGLQPIAATAAVVPKTGAMLYQGKAKYPIHEVVVHCTATKPD